MLSMIRRRRVFAKVVLWILIGMISIGLIAWYGVGLIPQAPPQQQQSTQGTSQQ